MPFRNLPIEVLNNAIEKQSNDYKALLQATLDGFWLLNKDGRIIETNNAYAKMSGYSKNEIVSMHISDFEVIESKEETQKRIEKIIKNGSDLFRTQHRKKDGSILFVEVSVSFVSTDGGKFICLLRDTTRRIENEKELKLASKVFEYSNDAIVITDKNNQIVSVNKSFEKLTGYKLKEIIGKNPKVISSGWGDKSFYKSMWRSILNDGIWKGEIWDRRKDGSIYNASEHIIAIKNKKGKVVNYIGISHDMTELKNYENQITQLAFYDPLTKLPNKQLFQQEVESFIKSSHFNKKTFAILFLDLDNFKWINDSLGHHFGDKVLLHVSKLVNALMPEDAMLSRLGGDEFVILVPYVQILSISRLALQIIDSLRYPILVDNQEINVSWSIGITLFPKNGKNYDLLLQNADTAMYQAKEIGKNTFKYFDETMNESAKKRLELDTRLRYAVDQHEFSLVYQPKVSCSKKAITGFEALLRWNDSKLGFVPPDEFIPIAEHSGYIYDIGHWVLEQAIQDIKIIRSKFEGSDYTMAINISSKQLEDSRFINDVKRMIDIYEIQKGCIEFEITETAVMQNITQVIPKLQMIKDLGIKLSIDDFGTGYSSLVYLKKMPIDTLKIDREFISDIDHDNEDRAIVQATIALAKTLNLQTVAEGVEKLEHSQILQEMKCDNFQGYYYSKPLALYALFDYLENMKNSNL